MKEEENEKDWLCEYLCNCVCACGSEEIGDSSTYTNILPHILWFVNKKKSIVCNIIVVFQSNSSIYLEFYRAAH